jgi:uncharacterized membrane protein YcaP (DUF421 family)
MVPILRAAGVYIFLLVLMRIMGKRTMAEVTAFDFIVLLIVSECTQQAMTGNDFSVTNAALLVSTLVVLQRASDWLAERSKRADRILNDQATLIVQDGRILGDRMRSNGVTEEELLEEARSSQGVANLEGIRHAVLERNGSISIIPR